MSLVRQVIFKCDHSKQKRPFAGPYSAHAKLVTSLHSNISDSEYRAEKVEAFTDVAILCNEYAQKLEGCVEIALFPKNAEIQLLLTMPPSFLRSMI